MTRKQLNLLVVPAVLGALLIAPFLLYWSDLPNPMAIHWGPGGEPDGSAPAIVLLVGLALMAVAVVVAVRRVVAVTPGEGPSFIAGMYAILVVLVVVSWLSVLANRNVAAWEAADSVTLLSILIAFAAGLGAGVAGWYLSGGNQQVVSREPGEAPVADVEDPVRAVWSSRGYGKLTTVIGIGAIIAGITIWQWAGWILVLIGLVALMFSVVRVTVSGGWIVVSLGWWGYPIWKVSLDSVQRAEVESVHPMAYGGWGYRVRPGVRAVVTRGGDAIRLVRDSGSDLVYTVDDANTGAGLINAIVGARR